MGLSLGVGTDGSGGSVRDDRRRPEPDRLIQGPPRRLPTVEGMSDTKKVLLAAPRGYCAGVDRAVVTVEKALELYGPPVYVRKEIVHNKHVVTTLEKRGAIFVDETEQVPEGATVVFSAHGVAPVVHEEAKRALAEDDRRDLPAGDEGAPRGRALRHDDYDILLIGHEGHEEVVGTSGEAPEHITLVDGPTMSPMSPSVTRRRSSGSRRPRSRSTRRWRPCAGCARSSRQAAGPAQRRHLLRHAEPPARREADGRDCDLMIVVGSRNSSNSVRLVEVALEHGSRPATSSTTPRRSTSPGSTGSGPSA
jgi:4-hydroxy-3-methylbut-2-enyl diphosphate reductase